TSARPRSRYWAGGVPSLPSSAWMPSAGALRGAPASSTTTLRRERASMSALLRPAAPPPMTARSTRPSGSWSPCSTADDDAADEVAGADVDDAEKTVDETAEEGVMAVPFGGDAAILDPGCLPRIASCS